MTYVDCDSHILPPDAFDEVAPEFRDEGPRIAVDAQGNSAVVYPARQRNIPDYARHIPNPFNPRPRTSGDDPSVRVADMTKAHFDMQVLVPSNGAFYYDVEPKLALSVCRSYNNAIGRILKKFPGKFFGLATVPLQQTQMAAEELERAVRGLGLHGAVSYSSVKEKDLDDEELWLFYEKAQALGVPIIVHPVNTGPMAGGWRMTRHYKTRGYGFWSALGNPIENSIALANLMFGGVLDAFPGLRFCFMEGGGTQVPHLMESLSAVYQGEGDYDRLKTRPKREPAAYLDRLFFSIRPTEGLLGVLLERLGNQSWVVGTDYPHADTMGSWPNTVPVINAREDLSKEAKDAILGGNALRLFGVDGR
ncbi:MAG TPA: amidohydrolase family protein [Candidatus Binatia bacterium]|jgi:aminocarboxymuconate-semialdehyde decarboxylase